MGISIHAPRVGSDKDGVNGAKFYLTFQSTLPVWGATVIFLLIAEPTISIHAPRVGSDVSFCQNVLILNIFQSTLPVWGATAVSAL